MRLQGLGEMLNRAIRLRCPGCGLGRLFRGPFTALHNCAECHLRFEREQGYYLGAIYLNYGATVVLAITGYFLGERYGVFTLTQQIALWGTFSLLFPLWFFRYSRSLWLALDHFFDPEGTEG